MTGAPPEKNADPGASEARPTTTGLATRALRGGLVTASGTIAGFIVRLASNALFARQMTPEEFGVWGFAAVWATLASLPYALSLPTAMLQLDSGTRRLFGTVRAMTLKLVAVVLVGAAVAALVIGGTQGASVAWCFLGLVLGQAFSAISYVYDASVQRAMRYHVVAATRLAGVVGGLLVAVPFAFATPGPLVLVMRDALPPAISLGLVMLYLRKHRRDPELALEHGWDADTARAVRSLGSGLLGNRLVESLVNRLDSLLVGLAFGEKTLGSFDQARYLAGLPNAVTGTFTHSVALRTFAAVRDDPARLARALSLLQWLTARVTLAGTCLCLVVPELLVELLFGPGWGLSAEMLRTFAPWLALVPLVVNQQVFLTALGTLKPVRRSLLLGALALPLGVGIALPLEDAAWSPLGNTLSYLAMFVALLVAPEAKLPGTSRQRDLLRCFGPPLAGVGAGALCAFASRLTFAGGGSRPEEAIAGAAALAGYVGALFLLEGRAVVAELRYLVASAARRTG